MAKCGLRVGETVRVSPDDITTNGGENPYLQVKSLGKTREVPLPHSLHTEIQDYVDEHQTESTESIVDRSERTVSRWVNEATEECYEDTGDETWLDLSTLNLWDA
jgi:integrase